MKNKEYIESGILETYALGMLSAEEASEVEAKVYSDPELLKVLREIERTLEAVASAHSVAPRPEWKKDILNAAKGGNSSDSGSAAGDSARAVGTATTETPVRRLQDEPTADRKPGTSWLAVAATIVLLFSLGINFVQYRNIQKMKDELLQTELRLANLEMENESMVANYRQMEESLAVLHDPSTATFVMKGVEGRNPAFRADVFWNASSEKVYLDIKNLPRAPAGKEYQLWALKDGKPLDMGVFGSDLNAVALLEMGEVPGADAFAVTLEPQGGSQNPTMEEMYVYGGPLSI